MYDMMRRILMMNGKEEAYHCDEIFRRALSKEVQIFNLITKIYQQCGLILYTLQHQCLIKVCGMVTHFVEVLC